MKVSALYIHVPFCLRKCKYCDFISYPCAERGAQLAAYASLVERELHLYNKQSVDLSQLRTVYFGGGTPSLLSAQEIRHILSCLPDDQREQAEITLEANPETVDGQKLLALRQAGVNRISFGVQSFQDAFLQL